MDQVRIQHEPLDNINRKYRKKISEPCLGYYDEAEGKYGAYQSGPDRMQVKQFTRKKIVLEASYMDVDAKGVYTFERLNN